MRKPLPWHVGPREGPAAPPTRLLFRDAEFAATQLMGLSRTLAPINPFAHRAQISRHRVVVDAERATNRSRAKPFATQLQDRAAGWSISMLGPEGRSCAAALSIFRIAV
jgi:hypothetical protein